MLLPAVKIIRPGNFLIIIIAGILGTVISNGSFENTGIFNALVIAFSAAFIGAAGNVINDIIDIEIDKINRPSRPLPSGLLSLKFAKIFFFVLSAAGITLSAFTSYTGFFIAVLSYFIIVIYSLKLKRIPLTGNITVAFFTGLIFIYACSTTGNYSAGIMPFIFAFLTNFMREILKDIEDIEGDTAKGVITFPSKAGIKTAITVIKSLGVLLILSTFVAFYLEIYKIEFFVACCVIVNPLIFYFMNRLKSGIDLIEIKKLSSLLKLIMILGLFSIFLGI
ncbi:MAG: UbiA family prenyltransferase [Ignavibacteriaceae bacterium]|nr:UbiA family prenyltransferase [Ignavibacteriaceae bacterium]